MGTETKTTTKSEEKSKIILEMTKIKDEIKEKEEIISDYTKEITDCKRLIKDYDKDVQELKNRLAEKQKRLKKV